MPQTKSHQNLPQGEIPKKEKEGKTFCVFM
jgi:hypothetical protein